MAGHRPSTPTDYKGRNVIERGFNTVKQWRGLATRYDKLAVVYRGGAVLRAITIWTAPFIQGRRRADRDPVLAEFDDDGRVEKAR